MIDWGAYLDGSLPPAEMDRIIQGLDRDPALRAQLEGYQNFVRAIGDAGQASHVPTARLEAILHQATRPELTLKRPRYPILIAATLMFMIVFVSVFAYLTNPELERGVQNVSSFEEGEAFLSRGNGWKDPIVRMASFKAELKRVSYGRAWVKCGYLVEGQPLEIKVMREDSLSSTPAYIYNGRILIRAEGGGIGFKTLHRSYVIKGCQLNLKDIAAAAAAEKFVAPQHSSCGPTTTVSQLPAKMRPF